MVGGWVKARQSKAVVSTSVHDFFHFLTFILENVIGEDYPKAIQIVLYGYEYSINLSALKQEISFRYVISGLKSKNSFKKIALLFLATLWALGPSIGDIGSDIKQGHLYLDGDIYIKTVTCIFFRSNYSKESTITPLPTFQTTSFSPETHIIILLT